MLPSKVFGAVLITEIMYDLPGSDTGREWVEVTNTGTDGVDISSYKFNEGGTNHTLTILSGTPTLAAGQSAVIISNADKFAIDWPQFSGTLFKSSFSLSNTGETLSLKDKSLTLLDSASYTSDAGAAGDGNTLHRVGDTLVAGAPDPGVYTSATPPTPIPTPDPTPAPTPDPTPAVDTTPVSDTSTTTTSDTTATTTPTNTSTTSDSSSTPAPTSATSVSTPPATSAPTPTPAPAAQTTASTQTASTQTSTSQTPVLPTTAPKTKTTTTTVPATHTAPPTTSTPAAPVVQATHAVSVAAPAKVPPVSVTKAASYSTGATPTFNDSNAQVSAVASAPLVQNIPPIWLYVSGLVALIALGIGGVLYAKPQVLSAVTETVGGSEEFELE